MAATDNLFLALRMKDCLHAVLRDNNRRVLNLYDEWGTGGLPLSFTKSKTEESCVHDAESDAFQGT